jgi:DHA2 family multidrug resistance protein
VAFMVFGLIFWMRSQFTPQADFVTIMIPSLVQGIAMATFFVPLMTLIFSGLGHDRIAAASGLSNFVRIMAGGFGASIFTSVWVNRTSAHHAVLTEHINFANVTSQSTINSLDNTGMSSQQILGFINNLVNQQAATMAADDLAWLSAVLFIVMIGLIWLIHPIKSAEKAEAAAGGH